MLMIAVVFFALLLSVVHSARSPMTFYAVQGVYVFYNFTSGNCQPTFDGVLANYPPDSFMRCQAADSTLNASIATKSYMRFNISLASLNK